MKGIIRYAENGDPICEYCGKQFNLLLSHVRQVHKVSSLQYRKKFGLNKTQPICNPNHSKHMRKIILADPLLIKRNLGKLGKPTRLKVGSKLRKGVKETAQGKINRLERNEVMIPILEENGYQTSRLGVKDRFKRRKRKKKDTNGGND